MTGIVGGLAAAQAGGQVAKALKIGKLIAGVALVIFIASLFGEIEHQKKLALGFSKQVTVLTQWQGGIMREVDHAAGAPVPKEHDADHIRAMADSIAALTLAVKTQNNAIAVAATAAEAAATAAKAAAGATVAQNERERLSRSLLSSARSGGLSSAEWGKL